MEAHIAGCKLVAFRSHGCVDDPDGSFIYFRDCVDGLSAFKELF